jgi:prefoldin subunit 5
MAPSRAPSAAPGGQQRAEEDIRAKCAVYEAFLSDRLRPDLQISLADKEKLEQELNEYDDLDSNLAALRKDGSGRLKTLVDLGNEVLCQALVPDTSSVFINIGLGFHLECMLDEAPRVIQIRREVLERKVQEASVRAAKIKAHIKMTEEGIRELMGLSEMKPA